MYCLTPPVSVTQDCKNAVEEYVYDLRSRLAEELSEFEREDVKASVNGQLDDTENWLYEDGEECQKNVYVDKLAELKVRAAATALVLGLAIAEAQVC